MKTFSTFLAFHPDGTIQGFYSEAIDLCCLGHLTVKRVSTIEFDQSEQVWKVFDPNGNCLFSSRSRTECLRWEEEHLH